MSETVALQSEPEEMQVVTSKQPEVAHSEAVRDFQSSDIHDTKS